jgi:hypothetical protein
MRALVLALAVVVAAAAPAFAHTGFEPDEAAPGSVVTVQLNAADERDAAAIAKVELFPPDELALTMADPIAATPGWTGVVLADRVEWTGPPADGDQVFSITLGPFPSEEIRVQFKVLQTYDNGDVDRWIDDYPIDGAEPEMPGPFVDLVPGAAGEVPAETVPPAPDTTLASGTTDTTLAATPLESSDTTGVDGVAVESDGTDTDDSSALPIVIAVVVIGVAVAGAGYVMVRRRKS